MGWGHYCPNEYPVEGSVNWENLKGEAVKEGGTLSQQGNPTQTQPQAPVLKQPSANPGQSHPQ